MNTIYKTLTYLVIIFGCLGLQAQTNAIDYTLNSDNITILENTSPVISTITKAGNTLTWTQAVHGKMITKTFTIQNTTGSWDTSINTGNINYDIALQGHTFSFKLSGNPQEILATLSLGQPNSGQEYSFKINTITYQ